MLPKCGLGVVPFHTTRSVAIYFSINYLQDNLELLKTGIRFAFSKVKQLNNLFTTKFNLWQLLQKM